MVRKFTPEEKADALGDYGHRANRVAHCDHDYAYKSPKWEQCRLCRRYRVRHGWTEPTTEPPRKPGQIVTQL